MKRQDSWVTVSFCLPARSTLTRYTPGKQRRKIKRRGKGKGEKGMRKVRSWHRLTCRMKSTQLVTTTSQPIITSYRQCARKNVAFWKKERKKFTTLSGKCWTNETTHRTHYIVYAPHMVCLSSWKIFYGRILYVHMHTRIISQPFIIANKMPRMMLSSLVYFWKVYSCSG